MRIEPMRQEGYQLLHDGVIELARVEENGIRIDVSLMSKTKKKLTNRMRDIKAELHSDDVWRVWRKRYGSRANLTSRDQLAAVLHVDLDFEVDEETEGGRPSMNKVALKKFDNPFLAKLVRFLEYDKALNTFIACIERELVGDRIHPVFNLHTVRSFRSSSNDPNFQNFPVRDKEVAEIIRRLFLASDGCVLSENDFKGIEVSVSACYHKDENFISYITTPGKDMHGDMAAQIYFLKPKWIKENGKDHRYGAKNKFVFPQFYGDYYVPCAKNLWDWIDQGKLLGPDGKPLKEWLRKKGIEGLGSLDPDQEPEEDTFVKHLAGVEDDFWNNRFMDYGQWRRDWYKDYLNKGYFDLLTGFRVYGSFRRNAVVNYPVQGAAFHCLLWTLIQVNRKLRKYRMKSKIVGQIHDSLIGDIAKRELRDYLEIVEHTVRVELRKHYKWLIVPLEIEYELCPPDTNWFMKREIKFRDGRFIHPTDPTKFTSNPFTFLKTIGGQN